MTALLASTDSVAEIYSPYVVLFLPLLAVVAILLFARQRPGLSAALSIGAILIAFGLCLELFISIGTHLGDDITRPPEHQFTWLSIGPGSNPALELSIGFMIDRLSLLMLLVVTGVGGLIHIFSWGYMREDKAVPRYFACLSLFTFSMLGIVLANNLAMMFIFWELVGVSSYLLIGHWFERDTAADAAKKAFVTNRIGDFGFLLGIIVMWAAVGSFNFTHLQEHHAALGGLATVAGLLLFCGAVGKSAQFPLHVWLPDAMEGPTPVSALIHAATMVAAGVYMLCRLYFIFTPDALMVISWVGGLTALLAALMAVQQDNIKRILAYSTLSQLGYMVMAVGLGGPGTAMFHLTTHAFFKALLFLGAGSVIIALHHEQDIWKMGGLRHRMSTTFITFLGGTLALCGLPPFSGFFSKDAILAQAWEGDRALYLLATLVAVLTAFYMFRLLLVAFMGKGRTRAASHAKESPAVMTYPLLLLLFLSAGAGFFGIDKFVGEQFNTEAVGHSAQISGMVGGLIAAAIGIVLAFKLYRNAESDPLPALLGAPAQWMRDRFRIDELFAWLNRHTQDALASATDWLDRWLIAGLGVKGIAGITHVTGSLLRLLQTGNLQTYALLLLLGVLMLLYLTLT
jgi:NADH-quinone oxidoreductase subunit L